MSARMDTGQESTPPPVWLESFAALQHIDDELERLHADRAELTAEALDSGVGVSWLADALGVTRTTLYRRAHSWRVMHSD